MLVCKNVERLYLEGCTQNGKRVIARKASQFDYVVDGQLMYKEKTKTSDRKEVPAFCDTRSRYVHALHVRSTCIWPGPGLPHYLLFHSWLLTFATLLLKLSS